jgi:hypothetical protein
MSEIEGIKLQLAEVKTELSMLRQDIQQLIKTCGRMDEHISFVDGVYSTVKKPMEFIVNKLSFSQNTLPMLEYTNDNTSNDREDMMDY